MPDGEEQRIDVYMAGTSEFDKTVENIRVVVHSGADPNNAGAGPSLKASNFWRIFEPKDVFYYARRMTGAVRVRANDAVRRGQRVISRRRNRG